MPSSMAWLLSYVWTPEGGDISHEDLSDTEAVMVRNDDDDWVKTHEIRNVRAGMSLVLPPVKAGLSLVHSRRHTTTREGHLYGHRLGVPPAPARIKRVVAARNLAREQMRGQAGAGGGKWASSR